MDHLRVWWLTVAPAGIVAVPTPEPESPFTLQVISLEVTSVTGLLLGGTRRSTLCPWSAYSRLSEMKADNSKWSIYPVDPNILHGNCGAGLRATVFLERTKDSTYSVHWHKPQGREWMRWPTSSLCFNTENGTKFLSHLFIQPQLL